MKSIPIIVMLSIFLPVVAMSGDIVSETYNGMLRMYDDSTGETIDVIAPIKLFDEFAWQSGSSYIIQSSSTYVSGDRFIPSEWGFTAVNSGVASVASATGGVLKISLGAADDDDAEFVSELIWSPSKQCSAEARVAFSTSIIGFNFGFNDTKDESADTLAVTYSTTVLTCNTTDGAVLYADSDGTIDVIRCIAAKSGVSSGTAASITSIDTDYHIYRVDLDDTGAAAFWLDGKLLKKTDAGAVNTHVPLCVYLGLIRRSDAVGAVYANVDYIRAWQTR